MPFRTMNEFRQALAELVGTEARPNGRKRKRSRKGRRARRNMAMTYDGITFDTVEELVAYKKAAGAAPAWSPQTQTRVRRKRKHKMGGAEIPAYMPTYSQAKQIGMAIGGMKNYCPNAMGMKMSHQEVLAGMGLTRKKATAVMKALKTRKLLGPNANSPKKMLAAQQILEAVAGVRCPIGRKNRGKRARRNAGYAIPLSGKRSDWEYGPVPDKVNWTAYPQYAYDVFWRPNTPKIAECNPHPRLSRRGGLVAHEMTHVRRNGKKAPWVVIYPTHEGEHHRGFASKKEALKWAGPEEEEFVHPATESGTGVAVGQVVLVPYKARRNGNSEAVGAKFVPDRMPTNAGPYLPGMYPYGQRGVSGTYAKANSTVPLWNRDFLADWGPRSRLVKLYRTKGLKAALTEIDSFLLERFEGANKARKRLGRAMLETMVGKV